MSPVPLYSGTTFEFLHAWGASYEMADKFKNSAKMATDADPSHFKHCSGIALNPVLFAALKCAVRMSWSSLVVILLPGMSGGTLNSSGGYDASKNSY
jgi:hypothetical protein